jgi:protein-S-isoprenylcysteine O-methyltransferase Ste14
MLAMLYSIAAYAMFVGSFAYAVLFLGNLGISHSLDAPARSAPLVALLVNVALLALFAVQHSVMARRGFKAWWTKIVPPVVERSTFVAAASVCLFLLCFYWQPIEGTVWSVTNPAAVIAIQAVFWLGWGVLLLASFLINHFELFGLRQPFIALLERRIPEAEFHTPMLYKYVRHPLYVGFLMGMWAAPEMTLGHLLFAAGGTGYILVGIWFEERDLIAQFGNRYRQYREQVGMLFPRPARRRGANPAPREG